MNDRLIYVDNRTMKGSKKFRKRSGLSRSIFSGEVEKHQCVDRVLKSCVHTEYRSERTTLFRGLSRSQNTERSGRHTLYFSTTNRTNHTNEKFTVFLFVLFVFFVVESFFLEFLAHAAGYDGSLASLYALITQRFLFSKPDYRECDRGFVGRFPVLWPLGFCCRDSV